MAEFAFVERKAQESRDRRERLRREYPDHAELTDWARAGGLEVAAVTVDGVTFGKRTPDCEPPLLLVSQLMEGLADGTIKPSGIYRDRGFRRNV